MTAFLFYGRFTPTFWLAIRQDAEAAPAAIRAVATPNGCVLGRFFFALEENDFYAVLSGKRTADLNMTRHRLMASGSFASLHIEQLFTYREMFPGGIPVVAS